MAVDRKRKTELRAMYMTMSAPERPIHQISNARTPNSAPEFDGDTFVEFALQKSKRRAQGLCEVVDGLKKD